MGLNLIIPEKYKPLSISLSLVAAATVLESMLRLNAVPASLLAYFCVVVFALTSYEFRWTLPVSLVSLEFFIFSGGSLGFHFPRDLIGLSLFALSCFFIKKLFLLKDERILELEARLKKENENRFAFALALSNGFKDSVNILNVGSQFLREKEPGTEKFIQAIGLIEEKADKIRVVMKDVTDTAMVGSGKTLPLVFQDLHLKTIVLEELISFEKAYPERFITEFTPMSTKALWSEDGIRRIIRVLCENALEFGDGRTIELKLLEDNEHATLVVKNTGAIIREKDLSNLFTPFHRMLEGLGREKLSLSLPLVKAIVEAHGGNLKVVSNEVEGTVFQILLPKRNTEETPPVTLS